jgi:hypothetical protein
VLQPSGIEDAIMVNVVFGEYQVAMSELLLFVTAEPSARFALALASASSSPSS